MSYNKDGFTGFSFTEKYFFGQIDTLENLQKILTKDTLYLAVILMLRQGAQPLGGY